jgi:hypothetical protein
MFCINRFLYRVKYNEDKSTYSKVHVIVMYAHTGRIGVYCGSISGLFRVYFGSIAGLLRVYCGSIAGLLRPSVWSIAYCGLLRGLLRAIVGYAFWAYSYVIILKCMLPSSRRNLSPEQEKNSRAHQS